jgi:hypothetical protein
MAQVLALITPPLPPGVTFADLPRLPEEVIRLIKEATKKAIHEAFPQIEIDELLDCLTDQLHYPPPAIDLASNQTRRERFRDQITHYENYPHVRDFGSWLLILLDSMQGIIKDVGTDINFLAQGKLGEDQLILLDKTLQSYQDQRLAGEIKITVCLHHSPFRRDGIETQVNWLIDHDSFHGIIDSRVDCVLFGHVGLNQASQELKRDGQAYADPPIINSENLERMSNSYPVALVDLDAHMRAVF